MILKRMLLTLALLLCLQSPIFANDTCESSFFNTGNPLTPEEVEQLTHMKDSILCRGNCVPTSKRIARYLITKDPKYITLPPMLERLEIAKQSFINLKNSVLGTEESTPIAETINSFDDVANTSSFGGNVDCDFDITANEIIGLLQESGPGSHAIVHGEYNSILTPWGHAFNMLYDGEGNIKVIGYKNNTVLSYHTWTPEFEELFLERYKNDFTIIRFQAQPQL